MPEAMSVSDGSEIGLAEMIESLRRELQISLEEGKDQAVAFDVDKVELELKVLVSRKAKGEGGIAFWYSRPARAVRRAATCRTRSS
jgi:hypothetical protein